VTNQQGNLRRKGIKTLTKNRKSEYGYLQDRAVTARGNRLWGRGGDSTKEYNREGTRLGHTTIWGGRCQAGRRKTSIQRNLKQRLPECTNEWAGPIKGKKKGGIA